LLTDIEGSTRLWETVPEAMEAALERHNRIVTEVIDGHGGVVVSSRGEGDSFFAAFASAVAAVEAAGPASCGSGASHGRRVRRCGCGWGCTPARRMCRTATMSTTRPLTGVPG
jgi:class 3 adenylate cyclase